MLHRLRAPPRAAGAVPSEIDPAASGASRAATPGMPTSRNRFRLPALAALVAAGLVAAASLGGLLLPSVYARETASWRVQGLGQDWVDLVLAAPWLAARRPRVAGRAAGPARRRRRARVHRVLVRRLRLRRPLQRAVPRLLRHPRRVRVRAGRGRRRPAWRGRPRVVRRPRTAPHRGRRDDGERRGVRAPVARAGRAGNGARRAATDLAETGLASNQIHVLDLSLVLPLLFASGSCSGATAAAATRWARSGWPSAS